MRSLIFHLRYTIRQLLKSPGFAATAVLTLGLGIGANTAIFSLVNGVLLKPLPYPKPDRLVQIFQPFRGHNTSNIDYPDFAEYCAAQHSFESLTAFIDNAFNLSGQGEAERVNGFYCSGAFFKVLGRPFLLGRPFGEAEDRPGAEPVVVLHEKFWRRKFNANPNIIGTDIVLDSRSFRVIGVTPGQADEGGTVAVYIPLSQDSDSTITTRRGAHYFFCIGRLNQRTTIGQAAADFNVISQNLQSKYPTAVGFGIRLVPYLESVVGDYAGTVWLLEGAVACVLLITCANIASLLTARAQERRKEITVRVALGASRIRVVSELLIESLVLALLGGSLGLLIGAWLVRAIKPLMPSDIPRLMEFDVDGQSLLFVVAVTIFTALASGLWPALSFSKSDVTFALKAEGDRAGTAGPGRRRNQAVLVAAQVALTCLLLTGAGLLIRSFLAVQNLPLGFRSDHVLTAELSLSDGSYSTQAECKIFFNALLERLGRIPGVISVALDDDLPFTGPKSLSFGVVGQAEPEPWKLPIWQSQVVSADFFRTIGIPLLHGRPFDRQVGPDAKQVIISERLAESIFPGQDPLGKQLHDYNSAGRKENSYTVIGIVPNIRHDSLGLEQTPFQAYFLYTQDPFAPWPISFCTVMLHTRGEPNSYVGALKESVAAIDPAIPLSEISTFDQVIEQTRVSRRLAVTVVALFSAAGVLLAATGLYSLLAYSVLQRKREIGVRIALGASSFRVLRLVVSQAFRIVGTGLVAGLIAALMLAHLMDSMLYGVSATDPIAIAISATVLAVATGLACLLPAVRATRIDPGRALRE
jgi:putative ABC transport system permease protein